MRILWAPWRIKYIRNVDKVKGCFICNYWNTPENDRQNLVLFRGRSYIILMNAFPYINGHLMVAPSRHVGNLEDLSDEELSDLFSGVRLAVKVIKRAMNPDGLNIGINIGRAAGAGLEGHLHVHVMPRWVGDHNFVSTVAETRVIGQALRETYEELLSALNELLEVESDE